MISPGNQYKNFNEVFYIFFFIHLYLNVAFSSEIPDVI